MIITDLTRDDTHFDSFLKLIKESYDSNHKLKDNYKDILETYDQYEAFIMLLDNETPVSFCGLQKFHNSLRTFTRYYLSEKYRIKKLFFASQYILPWSIDFAMSKKYSYLFTSFQSNFKRSRITDIFLKNANKYTYKEWTKLEALYNTCKNNLDKPQCWQHIIRCTLKEGDKWNLISQQN